MIKPVVLIILDGWGLSPMKEGNAIALAPTPNLTYLSEHFPYFVLDAAGQSVGLAWGEPGNSEVGHMTIGTGQIRYQSLAAISMSIEDGSFFKNKALLEAFAHARQKKSNLHFMGLYSSGGVHSHLEHLLALLRLAKMQKVKNVYLHLFTDGRDTPPRSALRQIGALTDIIRSTGIGTISTIMGRFYAMDRNFNWGRTEKAYRALTEGKGIPFQSPQEAVERAYEEGQSDEFIEPITLVDEKGSPRGLITSGDAVVFFNFRGDRAKQLTQSFTESSFAGFERKKLSNIFFVSFTDYGKEISVSAIAFPSQEVKKTLGSLISAAGMKQLRLAETEKAAHVTYFLNGGNAESYKGEDRILIRSRTLRRFDEAPEMNAKELASRTIENIENKKYNFIAVNFANPDMVAHTGNLEATEKAVSFIDEQIGRIWQEVKKSDGTLLITGDHGNAEELINLITRKASKDHSTNPVPLYVASNSLEMKKSEEEIHNVQIQFQPTGILADVTATILKLLEIRKPSDFVGRSLI